MEVKNATLLAFIIIGIVIGGFVGVGIGSSYAINACVSVGVKILEKGNVSLLIDKNKIAELILRYQHQVG